MMIFAVAVPAANLRVRVHVAIPVDAPVAIPANVRVLRKLTIPVELGTPLDTAAVLRVRAKYAVPVLDPLEIATIVL